MVTLTVTEKGYRIDPHTGSLNTADPQVQADLAGNPPQTAIGQITRGIQQRARTGAGPLTVVSCDNLPGNGELTGTLVRAFAAALPDAESGPLLAWLDANVTFPSTMVDRMVPATTDGDLDAVEHELGLRDEAAVVAEPFMQWVIEDNFAGGRPAWEEAGALFSTDVAAWEAAKLRLLNASHSMLAYLGLATGKETISDAVGEDSFRAACRRMLAEDALPTISLPAGPGRRHVLRPGPGTLRQPGPGPHHGQGGQRRFAEDRPAAADHRPRKPRRRTRTAAGPRSPSPRGCTTWPPLPRPS